MKCFIRRFFHPRPVHSSTKKTVQRASVTATSSRSPKCGPSSLFCGKLSDQPTRTSNTIHLIDSAILKRTLRKAPHNEGIA